MFFIIDYCLICRFPIKLVLIHSNNDNITNDNISKRQLGFDNTAHIKSEGWHGKGGNSASNS